jgi:ribA/ribD-fused uncharacterized protein
MSNPLPDLTKLALWGQACGDAFGAPFEYDPQAPEFAVLSVEEKRYLSAVDDVKVQPQWARLAGLYTDDTQQAFVLIDAYQTTRNTREAIVHVRQMFREMAEFEVKGSKFGVHRGTGKNFRASVTNISAKRAPDTAGMGAAMRVGPVATMFDDPHKMVQWVLAVSQVTTSNPVALALAAKYALMCWVMSHRGRAGEVANILWPEDVVPAKVWAATVDVLRLVNQEEDREQALLDYAKKSGWSNKQMRCAANGFALTGVPWAIYWGMKAETYEDALLGVCSSGGDTDTVAAMAGCLAALRLGMAGIPEWMRDNLVAQENVRNPHLWNPIGSESPWTEAEANYRGGVLRDHYAEQRKRAARRKAKEPDSIGDQLDFMDLAQEDMAQEAEAERIDALEPVLFGGEEDSEKYNSFSNFYQASFDLEGEIWPDTEHYYMAQKNPDDAVYQAQIREAPTAWEAKKLGREVELRPGWDDIKYDVMLRATYAKFSQNTDLYNLLLGTDDRPIHENLPDPWWGGGPNFPGGRDLLGSVLCDVREMLLDEQ